MSTRPGSTSFQKCFHSSHLSKSTGRCHPPLPRPDTQMFPLGSEAPQATSRCCEGVEEVLSFVANPRSEDSWTHVILVLLHQECGVKLFAHFSIHVWGHSRGGVAASLCTWHWVPKYLPRLLMNTQLAVSFQGPLGGEGANVRVFWKCVLGLGSKSPPPLPHPCLCSEHSSRGLPVAPHPAGTPRPSYQLPNPFPAYPCLPVISPSRPSPRPSGPPAWLTQLPPHCSPVAQTRFAHSRLDQRPCLCCRLIPEYSSPDIRSWP